MSSTHNANRSRAYVSWSAMKQRCLNPKYPGYENYGGRGITICTRWLESFKDFLTDMGERPEGLTLDRIENDGNYEPGNCRWATYKEQARNQRPKKRRVETQFRCGHERTPENTIHKGIYTNCRKCQYRHQEKYRNRRRSKLAGVGA